MLESIQLESLDNILTNIAIKIVDNLDLMKCLKFNTTDALLQSITEEQRYELINQDGDITNTRVFFQPFNNLTITEARSEIRIYHASFKPDNIYLTDIIVGFDIVVHNNLWRLDDGKRRPTTILKLLLGSLNGQDVNAIGNLSFVNRPCSLRYFNDSFTGYTLYMSTRST